MCYFRNHFKLNRSTVKFLLDLYIENNPLSISWWGRQKVGPSKEIHLFIWFLSNTETYRQLVDRFGIGRGTCCQVVRKVSTWMVKISPQFLFWPSKNEQSDIKYTIKEINKMPDMCWESLIVPPNYYFCYKKHYSIKYKQYAIFKWCEPGSLHDVRVFRRSPFFAVQFQETMRTFFQQIVTCLEIQLISQLLIAFGKHNSTNW